MAVEISGKARELLEAPNFCHLATLNPDGSPQVTPVWIDVEDNMIVFNTAEGRVKPRNIRSEPRIGLSITNQENPYEFVSIRGRVIEEAHEGAKEHINKLTKKYLGQDEYPFAQPGEVRVMFKIEPENIFTFENRG